MQSQQNPTFQTKQPQHFARLFPELEPLTLTELQVKQLALSMQGWDPKTSHCITNGLAIFSQFLAHDVTFEVTSKFKNGQPSGQLLNERTINFDLDCVYGQRNQTFYYDETDKDKLLLGKHYREHGQEWYDLQRNAQQIAIIPDGRNDENIIVSRFQVLMIQFHNRMVDYVREKGETEQVFEKARKLVLWHYHWLIVHEYLKKMLDPAIFQSITEEGCLFYTEPHALPLEFSGAAFRVGHSQSLDKLRINDYTEKGLFELGAFTEMDEYIDWRYLFDFGDGKVQFAKSLDIRIAEAFHDIPFINEQDSFLRSLPFRNMMRSLTYGLASGEDIACRLGFEPIEVDESQQLGLPGTPLWYYILKEAELLTGGEHLGPVGSTILGECFFTILLHDDWSYLKVYPKWKPSIGQHGQFNFVDLVAFVEQQEMAIH